MKVVSTNNKLNYNYLIIKKYTVGIVLRGAETKSIKKNGLQINQSYAAIIKNECLLYNSNINFLSYTNNIEKISPKRPKKLLLNKKEILAIKLAIKKKKLTLIPEKVFINDRKLLKMIICLCKGKRQYDKREAMKKRDFLRRKKNIY